MTPADEATFIELWQQGLSQDDIAQRLGIPVGTVKSRAHTLQQQGKLTPRPRGGRRTPARSTAVHSGTPDSSTGHTGAHPSTPPTEPTSEHPGTPPISRRHTRAHSGTPAPDPTTAHLGTPTLPVQQPTPVHPSVPVPEDLAVRLLSLLPDLEVMVARERDRQQLLSTPVGTPQRTVKKTYVVDTLYVDLIERYAKAEGVELKDVVNLAFHEFFARRDYLPQHAKEGGEP